MTSQRPQIKAFVPMFVATFLPTVCFGENLRALRGAACSCGACSPCLVDDGVADCGPSLGPREPALREELLEVDRQALWVPLHPYQSATLRCIPGECTEARTLVPGEGNLAPKDLMPDSGHPTGAKIPMSW